jgi:hypothetical protein
VHAHPFIDASMEQVPARRQTPHGLADPHEAQGDGALCPPVVVAWSRSYPNDAGRDANVAARIPAVPTDPSPLAHVASSAGRPRPPCHLAGTAQEQRRRWWC